MANAPEATVNRLKGLPFLGLPYSVNGVDYFTTGNVWFVDSGHPNRADDTSHGQSPDQPFATADYAVGRCTASNGDIIFLMPGHAENISSATSLVVDVVGVRIIGLGVGNTRPVFTYTATAGSLEIDAADCVLSNVVLLSSISAVVVGVNVDAARVHLDRIEFNFDATGDDFITFVDIDAVNGATVTGCEFYAEEIAGSNEAIRLDDCDQVTIVDNKFLGFWADAAIIGEGAAGTSLLITHNIIVNQDTTDSNAIDLNVAFTGGIYENRIGSLFATNVTALIDPGSCHCSENYVSNAIDETGIVAPTTAST